MLVVLLSVQLWLYSKLNVSIFTPFLGILFMLPSPVTEASLLTVSNLLPSSWVETFCLHDMSSSLHLLICSSFFQLIYIESITLVAMLGTRANAMNKTEMILSSHTILFSG